MHFVVEELSGREGVLDEKGVVPWFVSLSAKLI
jgi:hypothetical protein